MLTPQLQGLEEARHHQARILEQAAQAFDRGTLRVEVAHVYPLEEAAHAHTCLEAGGLQGKLVLAIA
jgi:NADPH2:quinone reductase